MIPEEEIFEKIINIFNTKSKNILILIGGAPGAGKTTLAKKIVNYLKNNFTFLSILHIDIDDKEEKELFLSMGGTDEQWPYQKWNIFHEKIIQSLNKNNIIIATATFGKSADRQKYEELCHDYDIEFLGIWLGINILQSIQRQKYRSQNEGHIDPIDTIESRTETWFKKYKHETSKNKFSKNWILIKIN